MIERKGKILIVDDTETNREILATMLERQGYIVDTARHGQEALRKAHATPDIILLDINMPGMDGYQVCKHLKDNELTKDIPVIFISALAETKNIVKGFEVGGVDYITKPFRLNEVLARVHGQIHMEHQRQSIVNLSQQKDMLLNIVSHDLKNPLAVIIGFADVLLDLPYVQDSQQVVNILRTIQRNGLRMTDLVNNLLDIARIEQGLPLELESVPLSFLLTDQQDTFAYLAREKNINFTVQLPPEDTIVFVSKGRMAQVLNNLVSNAIKYTPSGKDVMLEGAVDHDSLVIHVHDTGLGIPEDSIPHLFEKFFRVETEQHLQETGTGLGLSIVKQIVEQHRGTIEVESVDGEGSTFTIRLPLAQ